MCPWQYDSYLAESNHSFKIFLVFKPKSFWRWERMAQHSVRVSSGAVPSAKTD